MLALAVPLLLAAALGGLASLARSSSPLPSSLSVRVSFIRSSRSLSAACVRARATPLLLRYELVTRKASLTTYQVDCFVCVRASLLSCTPISLLHIALALYLCTRVCVCTCVRACLCVSFGRTRDPPHPLVSRCTRAHRHTPSTLSCSCSPSFL